MTEEKVQTEQTEEKSVGELWQELKLTLEALEKDVMRNAEKHNVSAGVRVRKGVRALRALGARLIRATTASDKQVAEARAAARGPEDKKPAVKPEHLVKAAEARKAKKVKA